MDREGGEKRRKPAAYKRRAGQTGRSEDREEEATDGADHRNTARVNADHPTAGRLGTARREALRNGLGARETERG